MILRRVYTVICLSLYASAIHAQAIGLSRIRQLPESGISVIYENDGIYLTDYYYTQGIQVALLRPSFARLPFHFLLLHPQQLTTVYGLALEHNGYTPTSIESDTILRGDRPFAASLMLESFAIADNREKHYRLQTQLTIGLMGPGAGGKEMQTEIHRHTNNIIPHGWEYQVANDLILNYYLQYERSLLHAGSFLYLDGLAGASIGTYNDQLFAGARLKAGLQDHPLFHESRRKFQLYAGYQPVLYLTGYDATMQGGLFNRSSPYILSSTQIERFVVRQEISATIGWKRITATASICYLSRAFKAGQPHSWGGLQLSVQF